MVEEESRKSKKKKKKKKNKENNGKQRKEEAASDGEQVDRLVDERSSDEPLEAVTVIRKRKKKKKGGKEGSSDVRSNGLGRASLSESSTVHESCLVEKDGCLQEEPSVSPRKRKKRKLGHIDGGRSLPPDFSPEGGSPLEGSEAVPSSSKSGTRKRTGDDETTGNHRTKQRTKRVSFSGDVKVFTSNDESEVPIARREANALSGKRFTREENELIKEAVLSFIKEHDLGDEGVHKILNVRRNPEAMGWLREVASLLPWRKPGTIYKRVHVLFASKTGKWTPEELEIINRHHQQSGSTWRDVAGLLGRFEDHVKDAWRRYRLPNKKSGHWSQDEYQRLFDLVNLDLRMKVATQKSTTHGNKLRENIAWYSISDKHATRTHGQCCLKWYQHLSSSMVAQGLWANCDDYLLIDALQRFDACCVEDVDWDHLLEHRSGDLCRKRWTEMILHIGGYQEKNFVEQVDILSARYCPDMYEYRRNVTGDKGVEC